MPQTARSVDVTRLVRNRVSTVSSPAEVAAQLQFLPRLPKYSAFRTRVLHHRGELIDAITIALRRDRSVKPFNEPALVFQTTDAARDRAKRVGSDTQHGVFALLPSSQPMIIRLTTVSPSRFWNRAISRFVRRSYPSFSSVLLEQHEFRDFLLLLEGTLAPRFRLFITELGLREPRPGAPARITTAKFDTDRKWTEASLKSVLAQVQERGQWFTSVGFMLRSHDKVHGVHPILARGRIHRTGEFHIDNLFAEISELLLPWLEQVAASRFKLLSNRGLRERNFQRSKPLEIDFQEPVFEDGEELPRFAAAIARYPSATKALFHANPYYHATVADVKDGSSIDLWVLSPSRLLLIPQAKSTAPAFTRLISHIFASFREGTVGEFRPDN